MTLPDQGALAHVQGLILAGGRATRLVGARLGVPKVLVPLGGRPLLQWMVAWLARAAWPVTIAVGQQRLRLQPALFGALANVFEDPEVGTAWPVVRFATTTLADQLIICNGDTINDLDLRQMLELHLQRRRGATIALTRRFDVQNLGAFAVTAEGRVLRSREDLEPGGHPSALAAWHGSSTGVVIVPAELLRDPRIASATSFEREVMPHLIDAGDGVHAYDNGLRVSLDIGTVERLNIMRRHEKCLCALLIRHARTFNPFDGIAG